MVLAQDLRRVTDINTYEAACCPSFALEIFYASSDGVKNVASSVSVEKKRQFVPCFHT